MFALVGLFALVASLAFAGTARAESREEREREARERALRATSMERDADRESEAAESEEERELEARNAERTRELRKNFIPRANLAQIGSPTLGSVGFRRTTDDVMAEERARGTVIEEPVLMPERELDRHGLPMNPESPHVFSIPPGANERGPLAGQPLAPQALGVNFTAATLSGTNPTSSFPPDCDGAVGPTQYVVAVNGRIVTFNKTTGVADGVLNATTNTFFTSVRAGSGTSDPMVRFDRLSARWFVSIINVSTPNRWLLAVSDAASNGTISAGTVWTYYFFIPATTSPTISNGSTCLSDYPSLGIDNNALYMGVSEFCGTGQPFQQTDVFVIRKTSVLSGGPIVVTAFRALMTASGGYVGPFSARGADNYDPAGNEGYFVGVDGASTGLFWLNRVSDPGGTPGLSANIGITLPAYFVPRPVPHPSNTGGYWGRLDPLDDRPLTAHIRNQQLWCGHSVGIDNTGSTNGTYLNATRVGARWYQINVPVNTGTPTITQSGTVFTATASNDSVSKNYFIPSVMVSGQGHAAIGFSTAGETDNANAGTAGRLVSDALGTTQAPAAITTNTNTYNPTSDPGGVSAGRPRRWGDYSITCLDPLDDMSMWTVQEFCDANNSYGVRVTRLLAPLPATLVSLPDVQAGQSSVSVTLTGSSASGRGFFDPGANLASPARPFNHLSAAVTNGPATGTPPTVVSATYVDPTTVTLVLNTSAATANIGAEKYTLTITNPDGQTSAAAIVRVTAANATITASAGAGGTISPSGAVSVPLGGSQSFTITPDGCHTIADVVVDGVSRGATASYSFTNVTVDHTITASFAIIVETITASVGSGGTISPSGAVAVNCGGAQAFTIAPNACFSIQDVVVDGVSRGALTSYTFTNVTANHTIAAAFVSGVAPPGPVTGLAATQLKTGNGAGSRTRVQLTFTAPGGGATVEVWRAGFGSYPLYATSPGTGSVPASPGSYPPPGWTLTSVTGSGQTDTPPSRDFWYYVAYAKDGCGNASTVSNRTGGTLDYHLGDIGDGVTPGTGDNTVNTADASLLGTHYGASGAALTGFEYIDVGPTTNGTTDARPTVDQVVDFEDLVMFALNYSRHLSLAARPELAPRASGSGTSLSLNAPDEVRVGDVFDVPVRISGAGDVLALSIRLGWDPGIVEPVSVTAGDLLTSQGGMLFSPGPGCADAALMGAGSGIVGEGTAVVARFRAVATGWPGVAIAHVIGRDPENRDARVSISGSNAAGADVSATRLMPVIPNPTTGSSVLQYTLARRGAVDLAVFSVDGRRIRSITHGVQEVGRYQFLWNGADEHGVVMKSGLYFVRLEVAGARQTRVLAIVR